MIRNLKTVFLFTFCLNIIAASPAGAAFESRYQATLQQLQYLKEANSNIAQSLSQFEAQADWTVKHKKWLRFKLSPYVFLDPNNKSKEEKTFTDVSEFYIETKYKGWWMRGGPQIFTWGVTDGYNPLDVINPRYYNDPLRPHKMGVAAISSGWDFGDFRIEGLFIPENRKTRTPGDRGPWLPRDIIQTQASESGTLLFSKDFDYYYLESEVDNHALSANWGTKVEAHVFNSDVTLNYFEGSASSPNIAPKIIDGTLISTNPDIVDAEKIGLQATYYRQRVYGGSLVFPIGEILFKAEQAFTEPILDKVKLDEKKRETVVALEKNMILGEQTLTLLLQGTWGHYDQSLENSATSISRIFERAAMAGVRWTPRERWTVTLTALYDTLREQQLYHFDTEIPLSENFKAVLRGDIISAKRGTPLGSYEKNDNVLVGISGSL